MNTTLKRQCLRPGPWLYVMGNPDLEWVPKTEEGKKQKMEAKRSIVMMVEIKGLQCNGISSTEVA